MGHVTPGTWTALVPRLLSLQEKRGSREEARLQKSVENCREMADSLVPTAAQRMREDLPALLEKGAQGPLVDPRSTEVSGGSRVN